MGFFSETESALNIYSRIRKIWETKAAICILLAIILIGGALSLYIIDVEQLKAKITLSEILILLFIALLVYLTWYILRRPKRIDKNKIGLVLAISTNNETARERLKNDFIENLHRELKKSHLENIQIISLSGYHSKRIRDPKSANLYHKKTGGHLIVYGSCRVRSHEGKECYYLQINASVIHKPIPKKISQSISKEMQQVLPAKVIFQQADEIGGFIFTAENVGHASRYIMGIASFFSYDVKTAFTFHRGLIKEIEAIEASGNKLNIDLTRIRSLLPVHLAREALILAHVAYLVKKENYLDEIKGYLDVVQRFDPRNYAAHLLKGVYLFLKERNIPEALEEIRKSKNERDDTWRPQRSSKFHSNRSTFFHS